MVNRVIQTFVKLLALGVVLGMQGCSDRLCEDSSLKSDENRGPDVAGMRSYFESEGLAVFPLEFSTDGVLSRSVAAEQRVDVLWDKAVEVNGVSRLIEIPLEKPVCSSSQGTVVKSYLVMQQEGDGDYFCFVRTAIPVGEVVAGTKPNELVLLSTLAGVFSNAYLETAGGKHRSVGMRLPGGAVVRSRAGGGADTTGVPAATPVRTDTVLVPIPPVSTPVDSSAVPPTESTTTSPVGPSTTTPTDSVTPAPGESTTTPVGPTTEPSTTTPPDISGPIVITVSTPLGVADFLICNSCMKYPCKCWEEKPTTTEPEEDPLVEPWHCPYCGSKTCAGGKFWCEKCHHFECSGGCGSPCILCKQSPCICCKHCDDITCRCEGKLCAHVLTDPCEKSLNAEYCGICKGRCKCLEKGTCYHGMACRYFNPRYCGICEGHCNCLPMMRCLHDQKCEGFNKDGSLDFTH